MNDGYKNINIIDNASKNIELLDYLKDVRKQGVKVFYMEHNYGHRVFWESHLFDDVIHNQYYVLTDPDVILIDECPANYVEVFLIYYKNMWILFVMVYRLPKYGGNIALGEQKGKK